MNVDWPKYYEKEHTIYPLSETLNKREELLGEMARTLIPSDTMYSMLDVGCGAGHLTNRFMNCGVSAVTGIDIYPYRICFAREKYPRYDFEVGSIRDLHIADDSFDLVTAMEILMHIEDLDGAIEELKMQQKNGFSARSLMSRKYQLFSVPIV